MLEIIASYAKDIAYIIAQFMILGAAFIGIEKLRPAHKNTPSPTKDKIFQKELALALLNASIFSPIIHIIIAGGLFLVIKEYIPHQIFDNQLSALPIALQIIVACFIMDFSTYWRHRVTHMNRHLWQFHSVHHAAKKLTWITGLRLHPIDIFMATLFDVVILHVIGFSGVGIIAAILIIQFYNHFVHANIDLKYDKPIRYIFASPNFHRWHHATEKTAHNKNFCSMFSLLDLMFGTYHHPEDLPKDYGLEPHNQKQYPKGLWGWLIYPFKQIVK